MFLCFMREGVGFVIRTSFVKMLLSICLFMGFDSRSIFLVIRLLSCLDSFCIGLSVCAAMLRMRRTPGFDIGFFLFRSFGHGRDSPSVESAQDGTTRQPAESGVQAADPSHVASGVYQRVVNYTL